MLRFVATQGIVLSQAQQKRNNSAASKDRSVALRTRKPFFSRFFEFLFEAQMRKAEREVERHRRQ
jgi:hypothetical protein